MAKRYRAIVGGTEISKHRLPQAAVFAVLDHVRTHEHLIDPGCRVEAWVARGEDVVVDIEFRYEQNGLAARLDWEGLT